SQLDLAQLGRPTMPADTPQTIAACRECQWNAAGPSGLCKKCESRAADTPMVLVPRGQANAACAYLDSIGDAALGECGRQARDALKAALSASGEDLGAST